MVWQTTARLSIVNLPLRLFINLIPKLSLEEFAVKTGDVLDRYTLRAFHFACAGVGAASESEFLHLCYHILGPSGGLWTPLGKKC